MEGFKNIAIVNLLDDYSKKDYGFALYEDEEKLINSFNTYPALVVVNPRGKDNRVLGTVREIKTIKEYGKTVSAQVVGVVNIDGFNAREEDIRRKAEIKKQKDKIEKEFRERLDKLKDAEYYERMAKEYADKDPELVKLVAQLKELGE